MPASSYDHTPTKVWVGYAIGYARIPDHKPVAPSYHCGHCGIVEALAKFAPLVKEAEVRAQEILDFVLSPAFSGTSEYVLNLKTIAAASQVDGKFLGLLVSAPQAHAKHLSQTLIAAKKESLPSNWVGEIKQRLVFANLTITDIRYLARYNEFNGQDEQTVLYSFLDEATGNQFKWFASYEALGDKTGVTLTIKGTVKKHSEFKGTKETVLNRVVEVAAK